MEKSTEIDFFVCFFASAEFERDHSRSRIYHTAALKAADVVFCPRRPVVSCLSLLSAVHCVGGLAAAVAVYQYSGRRTQQNHHLSYGTIRSPVAVQGCWTCFLPFSLLRPSLPSHLPFFPLCNPFASVQTQIPVTCFPWTDMSAMGVLKGVNVLTGVKEACGSPRRTENQKNRLLLVRLWYRTGVLQCFNDYTLLKDTGGD